MSGALALKCDVMEQKAQAGWDQEYADRIVRLALARLREVRPGASNQRVRQLAGEVESAYRLRKPASLKESVTLLHQRLDEVEENRRKREEKTVGR